jgi:hypothetical protein
MELPYIHFFYQDFGYVRAQSRCPGCVEKVRYHSHESIVARSTQRCITTYRPSYISFIQDILYRRHGLLGAGAFHTLSRMPFPTTQRSVRNRRREGYRPMPPTTGDSTTPIQKRKLVHVVVSQTLIQIQNALSRERKQITKHPLPEAQGALVKESEVCVDVLPIPWPTHLAPQQETLLTQDEQTVQSTSSSKSPPPSNTKEKR